MDVFDAGVLLGRGVLGTVPGEMIGAFHFALRASVSTQHEGKLTLRCIRKLVLSFGNFMPVLHAVFLAVQA